MLFNSIVNFSNPAESAGIKIPSPATGKVLCSDKDKFEQPGEGVLIKLEGHEIIAPITGRIIELLPAQAKVIIQNKNKLRFVIALPIEFSEQLGLGIKCLVSLGQTVKAKTPIFLLDLYKVQQQQKQLHLTFSILDYTNFKSIDVPHKRVTAGEDSIFSLVPKKK